MKRRILFPVVSPMLPSKEEHCNRGYFSLLTKLSAFCFCCLLFLPASSLAQKAHPTLTLETVNQIKANSTSIITIEPQKIPFREKYMLRFDELGAIYNPNFPNTRNMVSCANFHRNANQFSYISKSGSTFRATIFIKNLVGNFTSVWQHKDCVSLLEYQVTRKKDMLEVTGKVYTCLPPVP